MKEIRRFFDLYYGCWDFLLCYVSVVYLVLNVYCCLFSFIFISNFFCGYEFLVLLLMRDGGLAIIPLLGLGFLIDLGRYKLKNYFFHGHRITAKWIIPPTIMGIFKKSMSARILDCYLFFLLSKTCTA